MVCPDRVFTGANRLTASFLRTRDMYACRSAPRDGRDVSEYSPINSDTWGPFLLLYFVDKLWQEPISTAKRRPTTENNHVLNRHFDLSV